MGGGHERSQDSGKDAACRLPGAAGSRARKDRQAGETAPKTLPKNLCASSVRSVPLWWDR